MDGHRLLSCSRQMRRGLSVAVLKRFQRNFHSGRLACAGLRADGWWIADHKPVRHPETPEERKYSAMKYGLREEDYKAYEPGSINYQGDYPDLGEHTYAHKDPYENWSDDTYRRNYSEPMQQKWDMYRPDRVTFTGMEEKEDPKIWFPQFVFLFGTMFAIVIWAANSKFQYPFPKMPKQYPFDYYRAWPFRDPHNFPIRNYSFEALDEGEEQQ